MMPRVVEGAPEHQEPEELPAMRSFVEDFERKVNELTGNNTVLKVHAKMLLWKLDAYEAAVTNHGLNKPETELAYMRLGEMICSASWEMAFVNDYNMVKSQQNAPMQPIFYEDAYYKAKLPKNHEDIINLSKHDLQFETTEDTHNAFRRGFPLSDGEKYSQQFAHMQSLWDEEAYCEAKLPENHEDIINLSKHDLQCETTEDMHNAFCRGFSLNDSEKWLFRDIDGKICLTVPAREALEEGKWEFTYLPDSRFEEVAENCNLPKFRILCKFRSKLLAPQTTYGVYLVYKLPEGYKYVNPPPVQVVDKNSHPKEVHNIFLQAPRIPVISSNAMNQGSNPSNMRGLPKLRSDGWMEVQVHEFQTCPTIKMVSTHLSISSYDMGLQGITVQCLEFRPV